jgi:hypothetical protein
MLMVLYVASHLDGGEPWNFLVGQSTAGGRIALRTKETEHTPTWRDATGSPGSFSQAKECTSFAGEGYNPYKHARHTLQKKSRKERERVTRKGTNRDGWIDRIPTVTCVKVSCNTVWAAFPKFSLTLVKRIPSGLHPARLPLGMKESTRTFKWKCPMHGRYDIVTLARDAYGW